MNKHGVLIFEIGLWLMRILMVIVIIAGVALQIRTYVNTKVNLDAAEPALLIPILGTSQAFLYRDATGTYQRLIDIARFKQAQPELNTMFDYGTRQQAAARLTLTESASNQQWTRYLNPDYYTVLDARRQLGTVAAAEQSWPTLLMENGQEKQGIMRVEVLVPK